MWILFLQKYDIGKDEFLSLFMGIFDTYPMAEETKGRLVVSGYSPSALSIKEIIPNTLYSSFIPK